MKFIPFLLLLLLCLSGTVVLKAQISSIPSTLCVGSSTPYTLSYGSLPAGGTWSSYNPVVAVITSGGSLTAGIAVGTTNITYAYSGGYSIATVSNSASPTATISYATPFCATGTASVTQTGTGITSSSYSSTSGLSINSTTGAIDLGASTPGTYTVTYTFSNGSCSNTTTASVVINGLPTVSYTGTTPICSGATETLNGSGAVSYSWTGGVTDGVAFTPAAGTNYYTVTGTDGNGCTNTASATIVVNSLPTITSTTNATRCGTGTVNLVAAASAGTINWYTASTGGTSVYTGTNYSPSISVTTIYYVDATASGCTTATRTAVTGTVNDIPTITSTTNATRCGTGTVNLVAAASAGTINWYTASTGGTSVYTGTNYSPSISSTTTYYVDATASGCTTAARTAVTGTINSIPAAPTSPVNVSVCPGAGAQTLSVTPAGSCTVDWYPTASGGSALATGSATYTTSTAGTYYAQSRDVTTGCVSATRTAVIFTINANPAGIVIPAVLYVGSTITLTDATTGGTWSSGTPSVGTINASTGVMYGVAVGIANITYTITGTGCYITTTVSVVSGGGSVSAITGTPCVSVSGTTILSDATAGGTWSTASSSVSLAASGTTVTVTGVSTGTAVVDYTTGSGTATITVTVTATAPAITGTTSMCIGATTTLSGSPGGGTWSSYNPSVATISSGTVTGVSAGTSVMSHIL